jgi:hypothetical protein
MDVDPHGVSIARRRDFAQVKSDGVERLIEPAVVSGILQDAVHRADNAPLASDIPGRARITSGIFRGDENGIADFEFAPGFHGAAQSGRTLGISGET